MIAKHLYFIRHGLSALGQQGLWAGSTDSPLVDTGRDQAKLAGQTAKDLGIDCIIASPLSRARETAEIIAREIGFPVDKIIVSDLVVERDFGPLEQQPWDPNYDVDSVLGAEPADSVITRARQFYDQLQTIEAENILVVSHGSFGRALRHVIHPEIPFNNQGRLENAQIIEF